MSTYFNPRSPRGGATFAFARRSGDDSTFQSTLPTRGSDAAAQRICGKPPTFQSTLPTRGSDFFDFGRERLQQNISIHAPHEGERRRLCLYSQLSGYFNPRSPRGGATSPQRIRRTDGEISIHAPHEGERHSLLDCGDGDNGISIHAPHEGERPHHDTSLISPYKNFNPRSPRGGATLPPSIIVFTMCSFQSTLPTRGSDYFLWYFNLCII